MPFGSDQSILENVVHNPKSCLPNYDDMVIMENTRYAQLIKYILNAKILCIVESQPNNIITLMCDAFGVPPPISKLSPEQASYHFLTGYTS